MNLKRNARFAVVCAISVSPVFAGSVFLTGNVVVSVEGNGAQTQGVTYGNNQAAPLSLFQYTSGGTFVNSLVLPQTPSGANLAVSGEYGSSSEGALQLSGDGRYLTIGGYGVNAAAFNSNSGQYSANGNPALAQSGNLTGQSYTAVPRVVALIDSNGGVNSSTGVYNVFDTNNIRSAYTVDGTNIYISGQGNGSDQTAGVFYTTVGGNSGVSITGKDTTGKTLSQDTRIVQVYNNTLYVSTDSKGGSNSARSFVGALGAPPATTLFNANSGPTQLTGFGTSATGKYTTTSLTGNAFNAGLQINLSPEGYFFANSTTLYVADSGFGKQNSATSAAGDGGLQKWSLSGGTWTLDYTLYQGLSLVKNPNLDSTVTSGTTGLLALAGQVDGSGNVQLFATNYTVNGNDQTYLYSITDTLAATTLSADLNPKTFTLLATAPTNTTFKGVSFAPTVDPVPEPASVWLIGGALAMMGGVRLRCRGSR
jgi:hypothetical protein